MHTATTSPVERTSPRKRVYGSHANTAHVWAQNTIDGGRSSDGRMHFDDGSIYSYGSHFEMARFTDHVVNGARVVLFNANRYSVSTGKHQAYVSGALRGLDVITIDVPNLTSSPDHDLPLDVIRERLIRDLARETDRVTQNEAEAARGGFADLGYYRERLAEARLAWTAFAEALSPGAVLPDNPGAWVRARDEEIAAERLAAKADGARDVLSHLPDPAVSRYGPESTQRLADLTPAQGLSTGYSRERQSARIEHNLSRVRSARLTLGKLKDLADAPLLDAAKLYVREWTARRDAWREVEAADDRDAARDERVGKATEILEAHRSGEVQWQHRREFLTGALESACTYGMGDAAIAELLAAVQREQALAEFDRDHYVPPRRPQSALVTPEQWQDGKGDGFYAATVSPTMVRRKGNRLETSRGAEVPWRAAVAVYVKAAECRREGATWHRNGQRIEVGHYSLDAIAEDGSIRVGCHAIEFAEMERLAIREVPEVVRPRFPVPACIA